MWRSLWPPGLARTGGAGGALSNLRAACALSPRCSSVGISLLQPFPGAGDAGICTALGATGVPGCCPSGHAPGTGRAGGTRQGEELFKSKRSQSPRPGERFLLGLVGLPGMCVLFLQEIPSESPAGVSRATGACGSAPPARIVPAPLCWPLYCHRHHRHGQRSLWLSPLAGCTPGSPLCVPSLEGTMNTCSSCPQGCPMSLSLLSLSGASPGGAGDSYVPLVTLFICPVLAGLSSALGSVSKLE